MIYQTKELLAMKLELESYLGNKALEEYYLALPKSFRECSPWLECDLRRVQQNIMFIEQQVSKLPVKERTFLMMFILTRIQKRKSWRNMDYLIVPIIEIWTKLFMHLLG